MRDETERKVIRRQRGSQQAAKADFIHPPSPGAGHCPRSLSLWRPLDLKGLSGQQDILISIVFQVRKVKPGEVIGLV